MDQLDTLLQALQDESYAEYERLKGLPPGAITSSSNLGHNDEVDAFRHAYVSAKLRYEYGRAIPWVLGTGREARYAFQSPWRETVMDLLNNKVGRAIGAEASRLRSANAPHDLGQMVMDELTRGQQGQPSEMITDPADPRTDWPKPGTYMPHWWRDPPGSPIRASASPPRPLWAPDPDVDPETGEPLKPIEWWQKRPPEPSLALRRLLGM